jgi:toxin-antitoxin system PIN domain toxin
MHLADVNIWLALAFPEHALHSPVGDWLGERGADARLLFCRSTQQSFLRLLTNANVSRSYDLPPLTNSQAWRLYERVLSDPRVQFVVEPKGTQTHWKLFTDRATASPKLWMDAYLAAFAVAGAYGFVTADRSFRQYSGLKAVILTPA